MSGDFVLVGVDDRPDAVTTAKVAAQQAAARGLDLTLAYGYADLQVRPSAPGGPHLDRRQRALATVRDVAAHLVVPARTRIEMVVEDVGRLELLSRLGADADRIVLGQHHLGIRERIPDPSLASQLAALVDCPLVIVPSLLRREAGPRSPVVVALDGETTSSEALAAAFDDAQRCQRMILALHAEPLRELRDGTSADERDLAEILAGWKADYPDVPVQTLVCPGEPTDLIVQASRDAAVMVVGRPREPGRGGWSRSVAAIVVKLTHCPLLIAPARAGAASGCLAAT